MARFAFNCSFSFLIALSFYYITLHLSDLPCPGFWADLFSLALTLDLRGDAILS